MTCLNVYNLRANKISVWRQHDRQEAYEASEEKTPAGFKESNEKLTKAINENAAQAKRLEIEWMWAEFICLGALCLAMISLVWLALRNF